MRRVRQAYSRGRTTQLQVQGASARVRLTHPTATAMNCVKPDHAENMGCVCKSDDLGPRHSAPELEELYKGFDAHPGVLSRVP